MERLNPHINIFVVTHKVFRFPRSIDSSIYTPIQVGTGENLGYLQENQLDNIAHKNKNFCELTALYFLWKNVQCRYAGLVHYRRYLCSPTDHNRFIGKHEAEQLLAENDLLLPQAIHFPMSMREQYATHHPIADWDCCRQVIAEHCPDYLDAFDRFSDGKSLHIGNMFIGNKAVSDAYCTWLFDILFEVEKRTDLSDYDSFQQRIFGFLSERLFNVWLLKNHHIRIAELPLYKEHTVTVSRNTFTLSRGKSS